MMGKNLGRKLERRAPAKSRASKESCREQTTIADTIPQKVGTELSFVRFADTVEPALAADILACKCISSYSGVASSC